MMVMMVVVVMVMAVLMFMIVAVFVTMGMFICVLMAVMMLVLVVVLMAVVVMMVMPVMGLVMGRLVDVFMDGVFAMAQSHVVAVFLLVVDGDGHVGAPDAAGGGGLGLYGNAGNQAVHGVQETGLVLQQFVQSAHQHIAGGAHITFQV